MKFYKFHNFIKIKTKWSKKKQNHTWQISHLGSLLERDWRRSLWCLLASLLAAWTSTSHLAHKAASSAQQITVAGAFSQTSHWIFIFSNSSHLQRSTNNSTNSRLLTFCKPKNGKNVDRWVKTWVVMWMNVFWTVEKENEDKDLNLRVKNSYKVG